MPLGKVLRDNPQFSPKDIQGIKFHLRANRAVTVEEPTVAAPYDLSNGSWTRTGLASVTHGQADPDGGSNADLLTEDSSTGGHWVTQNLGNLITGRPLLVQVAMKAGTVGSRLVAVNPSGGVAYVNLSTGVVASQSGLTYAKTTQLRSGWWLLTIIVRSSAGAGIVIGLSDVAGNASYTGDGTSNIQIYGVRAYQNRDLTHADMSPSKYHVSQSTSANQPMIMNQKNLVDNMTSNHLVMDFDGVSDFLKNGLAGNWTFLHDGTGCTAIIAFRLNALPGSGYVPVLDTSNAGTNPPGITFGFYSDGRITQLHYNGASVVINNTSGPGAITANTVYVASFAFSSSGAPTDSFFNINSSSIGASNALAAVSTATPGGGTLMICGDTAGPATFSSCSVYEIAIWNRRLSPPEISKAEIYMMKRYGFGSVI